MSRRIPFPVRRVTREQARSAGVNLSKYPNAGPYPNVTGMRKKFWGDKAALLRVGPYVYNVSPEDYRRVLRQEMVDGLH